MNTVIFFFSFIAMDDMYSVILVLQKVCFNYIPKMCLELRIAIIHEKNCSATHSLSRSGNRLIDFVGAVHIVIVQIFIPAPLKQILYGPYIFI